MYIGGILCSFTIHSFSFTLCPSATDYMPNVIADTGCLLGSGSFGKVYKGTLAFSHFCSSCLGSVICLFLNMLRAAPCQCRAISDSASCSEDDCPHSPHCSADWERGLAVKVPLPSQRHPDIEQHQFPRTGPWIFCRAWASRGRPFRSSIYFNILFCLMIHLIITVAGL